MKKKLLALALVLVMLPAVVAFAAEGGYADSRMEGIYAVIGGDETLTIRSHVEPGGQGGYSHALYAVELTGEETKAELDAVAVELLKSGAEPVWGGSKHCYHGGAYTVDPEYTIKAADREPGSYLYVCYAFGCIGGSYNHYLIPYYERISTMSVRVTEESRGMELSYALINEAGNRIAAFEAGVETGISLEGGAVRLKLESDVQYPNERVTAIEAHFPDDQAGEPFRFDPETLRIDPVYCGKGSLTVTIEPYLGGEPRTEELLFSLPCMGREELSVLEENTCTEDGLGAHLCYGYGVNCQMYFGPRVIPAAGHDLFSVSQILEKPTATLPGLGMGTCKVCGLIGVEQELEPIFCDVVADGFYSRALDHCYDAGWVTGVTADTFAPGNACVRAQVVTFLWRAAGCPEPESKANPFADVAEDAFYYDAVLWAVEEGITTGTDAAHFSPMGVCNRAHVVTFLWRAFGQPESSVTEHPFKDIQAESWYELPVLWAVEEGITSGMTATSFGPNANCNRAQIVTFLYRAYAESAEF